MGTLVGTEETPAFLCSKNAAKIMMRLSKAWLNVKVRAPGRGRAQGLPHEAWQGDPYPLMLFTHISAGEKKKKKAK